MSDDYANHPMSITEARAEREEDCTLWKPRDALISVLREIDSGAINPDALVVVYRYDSEDEGRQMRCCKAVTDIDVALGLLMRAHLSMIGRHHD